MVVSTDFIAEGICRLVLDGSEHLGIRVSAHKRALAGQLQETRKDNGWIVDGDDVTAWEAGGIVEHEGGIYLYGPHFAGRTLTGTLAAIDRDEALALFSKVVDAFSALSRKNVSMTRIMPSAILVSTTHRFLFLPQSAVDNLRNSMTEAQRVDAYERFNHPDLSGERNIGFSVGVLAYRALTASYPFEGTSSEEIHHQMREREVVEPSLIEPELRPDVSRELMAALDPAAAFDLARLQRLFTTVTEHGATRELSAAERTRIEDEATSRKKRVDASYRRRVFFQRNWKTMLIVAGIVVIVGWVGGSILKNVLRPRVTVGMPPAQVVALFYNSITKLDSQTMQDCVIGKAGRDMISEATNLYVISRVREGYEGSAGYLPAAVWLSEGKPTLKNGESVYGVADLSINQDSPDTFTVSYEKWEPYQPPESAQPESDNAPLRVEGYDRVDQVHLKNAGKYWAIDSIDRTKNDPISQPVVVSGS